MDPFVWLFYFYGGFSGSPLVDAYEIHLKEKDTLHQMKPILHRTQCIYICINFVLFLVKENIKSLYFL